MAKTRMKKTMFPREFCDWMICSQRFIPTIDRDIDDSVIEYFLQDFDDRKLKKYSLDDLYEFWLFNVKNKDNETD